MGFKEVEERSDNKIGSSRGKKSKESYPGAVPASKAHEQMGRLISNSHRFVK